jgi:hypothetical protein
MNNMYYLMPLTKKEKITIKHNIRSYISSPTNYCKGCNNEKTRCNDWIYGCSGGKYRKETHLIKI